MFTQDVLTSTYLFVRERSAICPLSITSIISTDDQLEEQTTLNVSDEAEYHEVFKLLIPVTSSLQTVIKRVHYRTCNILVLLLYKGILRKR